jgi:uncharacterized protein DUF4238
MTAKRASEPRAHHIVPRCWLAGFTETGDNDGKLWVTDLSRKKQWLSTPGNSGHKRDFYRVSDPSLDPVAVETGLSKIEAVIAPILRAVDRERRPPREDELAELLQFIAIQFVRLPAFRIFALNVLKKIHLENMADALRSEESWAAAMKKADIDPDSPGSDYQGMKEFFASGEYTLAAATEWYMQRAFIAADEIASLLERRHWDVAISPSGSFIGCDNPVTMDGPKGGMAGFANAEIVIYQLSRHVLLYGGSPDIAPPFVNRKYIASMNTFAMLRAQNQVFSHAPDFCWLDDAGKCQSNWEPFSEAKILASVPD